MPKKLKKYKITPKGAKATIIKPNMAANIVNKRHPGKGSLAFRTQVRSNNASIKAANNLNKVNSIPGGRLADKVYSGYRKLTGSFKKGGKVKKTGTYKLHKGERVLNKKSTKKFDQKKYDRAHKSVFGH